MNIVVDASVIIAVVTNEKHKRQMVEVTKGAELIAPASIPWEIGNAFSAMFKRKRMNLRQAKAALRAYDKIPIQLIDITLEEALDLAAHLHIYAYDAYFIQCALKYKSPLLTLDHNLCRAARSVGAAVIEVEP
jgi:predicted nucleic acid-binding protein